MTKHRIYFLSHFPPLEPIGAHWIPFPPMVHRVTIHGPKTTWVHGPCFIGPWFMVHGSGAAVHGSWACSWRMCQAHEPWMAPGPLPKTGSNRAQDTAFRLGDFLFFLVFNNILWYFWGLNYSQMAN